VTGRVGGFLRRFGPGTVCEAHIDDHSTACDPSESLQSGCGVLSPIRERRAAQAPMNHERLQARHIETEGTVHIADLQRRLPGPRVRLVKLYDRSGSRPC
jgi:hypothetical protein